MSSFTFDDILAEAAKNRSSGEETENVRLDGTFNTEIEYAMAKKTKAKADGSGNHPMLSIKHIVLDGPFKGSESWQNLMLLDNKYSKAAFGQFVLSVGFTPEYLRTLPLTDVDTIVKSLELIAEELVGVRLNVDVHPNAKKPDFDDWTINSVPSPVDLSGAASAPVAQAPVAPAVAAAPQLPVPGAPFVPGAGFIPQLPTS